MTEIKNVCFRVGMVVVALGMMLVTLSCSNEQLGAGMIGRIGKYDYSPSVIQSGDVRQFWWCGLAVNPTRTSQETDAILYESVNQTTGATEGPLTVLAETKGAWDSVYSCNPKVIGGSFDNPLGDGQSFQYAMYYVATSDGSSNNIGVAFSQDGIHWQKYPQPVIRTSTPIGYGVGQPALYNSDHKAAITMFYEDYSPVVHHVAATSNDGVHFTVQGTLTTIGLDPDSPEANWGDMAYDSKTGYWYAAFNRPLRALSTTGNIREQGQIGVELYRIPDSALLTGSTPWQQLSTIDSNKTGYESNFIAGFVRDFYGNLNVGSYPVIEMYVSVSNPQPGWNKTPTDAAKSADPTKWDLAPFSWTPDNPLMPFYRYYNGTAHEVTTGWVSPSANFQQESLLGHLYESPQQGATVPFYGCKNGDRDYFVSTDSACEGSRILGKNGYGYAQPVDGLNLIALYRCKTSHDHFVSQDSKCEGETVDGILGYAVP
jgi:hypothetical protein